MQVLPHTGGFKVFNIFCIPKICIDSIGQQFFSFYQKKGLKRLFYVNVCLVTSVHSSRTQQKGSDSLCKDEPESHFTGLLIRDAAKTVRRRPSKKECKPDDNTSTNELCRWLAAWKRSTCRTFRGAAASCVNVRRSAVERPAHTDEERRVM